MQDAGSIIGKGGSNIKRLRQQVGGVTFCVLNYIFYEPRVDLVFIFMQAKNLFTSMLIRCKILTSFISNTLVSQDRLQNLYFKLSDKLIGCTIWL